MKDRKLTQLLNDLKDDPRVGGEFDVDASWNSVASELGLSKNIEPTSYSFRDYTEYYLWKLSHVLLKPVAASVAVFVFAITGWVSVANASLDALPGEQLYPVKIIMERAQLTLATSETQRAELRVEFASRRLEEMVEVANVTEQPQETIQLAVERFKNEVVNIQTVLQEEPESEIARTVGRNVEVYQSTVATSGTELSEEVKGEVDEILEETKEQAVEVIITTHEQTQNEQDARDLQAALEKQINGVSATYGDVAQDSIAIAKALAEEGEYRRAFQVLKEFVANQQLEQEPTLEDVEQDPAPDSEPEEESLDQPEPETTLEANE